MPRKIDRIGRANEWATRHFLMPSRQSEADMNSYLFDLPEYEKRRVLVGSKKASEKIRLLNSGNEIVKADVVGEASKTQGGHDFDIEVTLKDNSKQGYSLKIQKNYIGVNVRNPTLNSICKSFTGNDFETYISDDEKKWYKEAGSSYSRGSESSKTLGIWGAKKLAGIMEEVLKKNPIHFVNVLLKETRFKTNLVVVVVDNQSRFIGYVTKFVKQFERLRKEMKKITVFSRGISVYVSFEGKSLLHIDIYMMSDSFSKGTKLRAAIRVDFELDDNHDVIGFSK
tara:strand:+ start:959 stop:1807 length:849 start_codon:yes stop_codon:yes gene_type:complete